MLYNNSDNIAGVYVGDAKISKIYTQEQLIYQQKADILPYIVELTVSDGDTAWLNIYSSANGITIDWGDKTIEITSRIAPGHTYATGGVYQVQIHGSDLSLSTLFSSGRDWKYITGVVSWGNSITNMALAFNSCINLSYIPDDMYGTFNNIKLFNTCFCDCTSLTTIPEKLFANCVNTTSFHTCFQGCTSLTSIPERLFANCPAVTSFNSCFYNCTSLTGYTPKDSDSGELWERAGKTGYPDSINGSSCFKSCIGLDNYSDIPSSWIDG
ncbi:MAG: leucine-rich repeat domain-containing protein [Bacteroides sp.]|nr:leucine-rich repeat domain-containing protein [Bacteroides sp.]